MLPFFTLQLTVCQSGNFLLPCSRWCQPYKRFVLVAIKLTINNPLEPGNRLTERHVFTRCTSKYFSDGNVETRSAQYDARATTCLSSSESSSIPRIAIISCIRISEGFLHRRATSYAHADNTRVRSRLDESNGSTADRSLQRSTIQIRCIQMSKCRSGAGLSSRHGT